MTPRLPPDRPAFSQRAPSRLRTLVLACVAAGLVLPTHAQVPTDKPPARGQAPAMSSAPVTLNFVNADIEAVTRAISAMINRQILVDPRVKGSMTVYSERALPPREAYQNYLSALRGMGFAVVDSAGLLKVVPEADAKLQTGVVSVGPVDQRADLVITQIFRLSHENPNNLVAVLRPLISPNNTINANPGNATLVITDYADNLARIAKIIAALDQPASTDIEVITLKHAVAADLAQMVQRLGEGGTSGVAALVPGGGGASTTVMVDARSNSLIIKAQNPARLATMRALIQRLDQPGAGGPAGSIHVVPLKNADAARLATVLRAAFAAGSAGGGGGSSGATTTGSPLGGTPPPQTSPSTPTSTGAGSSAATTPVAASAQPSTGGFIQADAATNSLIISAPEPLYQQIRSVIERLDERRAQVYIESMIVEVTGNNLAEIGFQWLGSLDNGVNAVQTLPSTSSPGILGLNTSIAGKTLPALGDGLNVGLLRTVNGATSLTAILRLLQTQGETNIVSTPNLITLDNEEAKIVVGENVPFITGQFTSTGTSTTNPFQTIERKDVGITLRIRPQIGEGGAIRMQIYQEQSSVKTDTAAGTSNAGPSTTKRSIEGTVTVDDGQILALGGLIEDTYSTNLSKVPLLGDLPLVGALFRSESRTRKRSNLMVFLRPVVLRDADVTRRMSLDRYDTIRGQQKDAQPRPSWVMPDQGGAPVLPPLRDPAAASAQPDVAPPQPATR